MTMRSLTLHFAVVLLTATLSARHSGPLRAQDAPQNYNLSRIVAIGGDVTEILYELGLEKNIVAVDSTSQYPSAALQTKRNVGYMRALSAEGVLSMKPTVIMSSKKAGPPEVVAALKSTSIPFVEVTDVASTEAVYTKIETLAAAVNKVDEGAALQDRVRLGFEKLALRTKEIHSKPRALFVLLAQNGRALVGGKTTVADALFELAGLQNVASDITGFRPISNEAAVAMNPDLIITMSRGSASGETQAKAVAQVEGLGQTDAVKAGRILEVDAAYMLGFGPRLPEAASDLIDQVRRMLETG